MLVNLSKKDGYDDKNNDLSKYRWLIDWMNKQILHIPRIDGLQPNKYTTTIL